MRTKTIGVMLATVLAMVLAPAAMATSVLPLGASDFTIVGKNKAQWKGAKGLTAAIKVEDQGANYEYTIAIRGKGNKQLNRAVSRVIIGLGNVSDVKVNGKTLSSAKISSGSLAKVGAFNLPAAVNFTNFKVGGQKKLVIKFDSTQLPTASFLYLRGAGVQAVASGDLASVISPTADETDGQPSADGEQANVVPLPAAAWAGLSMLGGMGLLQRFRRRRAA